MKKLSCLLICIVLAMQFVAGQNSVLVFKGTVKCYIGDDERATKGAKNVIVVPAFIPPKSSVTNSQGYYELNTAVVLKKLQGKAIPIMYISSCNQCEKQKNVFIAEELVRESDKNLAYLTVETVLMHAGCRNAELSPAKSDSIFNSLSRLPSQDLDKISALNSILSAPAAGNALTNLVFAPIIVNQGSFVVDDTAVFRAGNIAGYGNFLFASPMHLTSNPGFNFSPNRNISEAVFWNPSALAASNSNGGVSSFTNIKNNIKLAGFYRINDRLAIGAGGIYTKQDDFRDVRFRFLNPVISHLQELKEYAFFLSPSYKINKKLSVGVGIKAMWQKFNIPLRLQINDAPPSNIFTDSNINRQKFDADVSVSYNITPAFKAGVNVMNIAGTTLFADAFPATRKTDPQRKLRSYGLGLCYKWLRFNFGTDVLITEDDLYDVTIGANYIPFNNALISSGFACKQKSFSLSFQMKYFRISYVNDNGLMVNERRKGKSGILNGQIYSGLTFGL